MSGKGPQASPWWQERLEGNLGQAAVLTSDSGGMTDPQSLAQNTHMFSGLVCIGWACTESNQFDLNRIESWKTTEGPGCVASPQILPLNKNPKKKRVRVRVRVGQALAEPALSIHDLTYRASHCMKAMRS